MPEFMYRKTIDETFQLVRSAPEGLSQEEAQRRLQEYGLNELQEKKKVPAWLMLVHQFRDIMILILIAAAVLSGIMGDITDTIIILIIVLLNAVMGFVQEYRAERAMEALKKMAVTQTQVLRLQESVLISSAQLVPGDIVLLEAGNVVPADMRLIETQQLKVDESSLTGESVHADKQVQVLTESHLPPGDQVNMAFKGTQVTHGRARGVVVATGMATELGKIAHLLQQKEEQTPLQARMEKFGKKLSYLILLICTVLFVTGLLRGEDPYTILLLSVSLAVAAIPEALPALITIALSRGASRLAGVNALVRKLPAVETLGSVTYICSDKTGTLTQNNMQVVEQWAAHPLLLTGMALNHDVRFDAVGVPMGESTEVALVQYALDKLGREGYNVVAATHPRMAEFPFDSDRKCMTTIHRFNGQFLFITKGASETVGSMLKDEQERQQVKRRTEEWAQAGKRVLSYAYKLLPALPAQPAAADMEKDLILAGMVGLMDPPRQEVKAAISECKTAGITPVMITGDHPATARAIARQIGILDDTGLVLTGPELQQLKDDDFESLVEKVSVYARVSPDQKLRIVRTLQQNGHYAAMTGDGVNDAPSLKAASIGVAMGINGTDVSKEAADLVLLDDHFATIVKAVKEGRRIFDNIRKFVKYIMTCNTAEIWAIFLAPLFGMPVPLLPIHILWINLVTDGLPALALAGEKAEHDIMKRPPRPTDESLFSGGVGFHIVWVGILMAGITLVIQAWSLQQQLVHWQTMVFTVLSLSQLGHVLAVRSDRTFLYRQGIFSNRPLLAAVFITCLLQLSVIYLPVLNPVFKTQPLSATELIICIGASGIVFHAVEMEKWLKKKFNAQR